MRDATFQEILEEKLKPAETSTAPACHSTVQPLHAETTYDCLFLYSHHRVSSVSKTPYYRQRSGAGRATVNSTSAQSPSKAQRLSSRRVSVGMLSNEAQVALLTLGLAADETISQAEVRRAFHRLAKRLHPDVATAEAWQAKREQYLLAQEAYDLVTHEIDRALAAPIRNAAA